MSASRTAVLGAGAWGTTFAQVLADAGAEEVVVWGRRAEVTDAIAHRHESPGYLPGVRLPDQVGATTDAAAALSGADLVVLAVPVQQLRATLARAEGIAAFMVFPDRTLIEMARQKPVDLWALRAVHCVGERKRDAYGEKFVAAIGEFLGHPPAA